MKPKNKPSVTQILGQIYPFERDALDRFVLTLSKEWLDKKRTKNELVPNSIADIAWDLRYDDVMKMLTTLGTIVHSCAYDMWTLWFCNTFEWTVYEPYVKSVIAFFEEQQVKTIAWELYIETDEYYWISDWVLAKQAKNILVDYKTWTAYKWLYGIANNILKKNGEPYSRKDDVEKTSLQLSLYDEWIHDYEIHEYWIVWFTEVWYFIFQWTKDLTIYNEWKSRTRSWGKTIII